MPPKQNSSARRTNRDKETLPKNLDWLPSVSRSGGTSEGDGDSLKQYTVQETYRKWIDEKLLEYEQTAQNSSAEHAKLSREDIIRRFRKLREGVLASNRHDAFATEVYESSLFLSAAYGIPEQVTAVAAQVLPPSMLKPDYKAPSSDRVPREITLFLILIHHLFLGTRSTSSLQWIVAAMAHPSMSCNLSTERLHWLKQVRLTWRFGNYHALWNLTSPRKLENLLRDILSSGIRGRRESAAITAEIEAFRRHIRDIAWSVMRVAYREESESWLLRSLSLPREDVGWISEKQKLQEAMLVPGEPPRWKVYKSKAPMQIIQAI